MIEDSNSNSNSNSNSDSDSDIVIVFEIGSLNLANWSCRRNGKKLFDSKPNSRYKHPELYEAVMRYIGKYVLDKLVSVTDVTVELLRSLVNADSSWLVGDIIDATLNEMPTLKLLRYKSQTLNTLFVTGNNDCYIGLPYLNGVLSVKTTIPVTDEFGLTTNISHVALRYNYHSVTADLELPVQEVVKGTQLTGRLADNFSADVISRKVGEDLLKRGSFYNKGKCIYIDELPTSAIDALCAIAIAIASLEGSTELRRALDLSLHCNDRDAIVSLIINCRKMLRKYGIQIRTKGLG